MHRLLVPPEALAAERAVLPPEAAKHLRVLRPRPGELVELFDGYGRARPYACGADGLRAAGPVREFPAPAAPLTLFACVTKGSRWDWTIEKAVELGATRIVPVISERCIVRLSPTERPAKAERWRRIAEDAARQSDAAWLPEVCEAVDFPKALEMVRESGTVFVGALVTPPAAPLLKAFATARPTEGCGIFVGPEGDFTPSELEALLEIAVPVSLGPTILRAETAAIYGLAVLAAAIEAGSR